jgi:hypothetical protein
MPPVPAVFAKTHVLGESIEIPRSRSVRLVAGDCLGYLLERREAIRILTHEFTDLGDAFHLDSWRDVNEYQSETIDVTLPDRNQARRTAHRSSDKYRFVIGQCSNHGH